MRIWIKKDKGFSLLELMAVVAIALILTIVAVNSYSAMKQRRSLRSGAESLSDVFMTARSLAVSRNAWHRVVLQVKDPTDSTEKFGFWIDEIDPNTSTDPNPAVLDAATRALVVPWKSLPETVKVIQVDVEGTSYTASLGNPYYVFRFRPNGTADDASVRLMEDSLATPAGKITSRVRLYGATAKSRIIALRP